MTPSGRPSRAFGVLRAVDQGGRPRPRRVAHGGAAPTQGSSRPNIIDVSRHGGELTAESRRKRA